MTGDDLTAWMAAYSFDRQSLAVALDVNERTVSRWRAADTVPMLVQVALEALARRADDV